MKIRNEKEIRDMLEEVLDGDSYLWDLDVSILSSGEDEVRFTFSQEYECPQINATTIFSLCNFFETMEIDINNNINYGGCETCDYGSSYGYTVTVKPNKGQFNTIPIEE